MDGFPLAGNDFFGANVPQDAITGAILVRTIRQRSDAPYISLHIIAVSHVHISSRRSHGS